MLQLNHLNLRLAQGRTSSWQPLKWPTGTSPGSFHATCAHLIAPVTLTVSLCMYTAPSLLLLYFFQCFTTLVRISDFDSSTNPIVWYHCLIFLIDVFGSGLFRVGLDCGSSGYVFSAFCSVLGLKYQDMDFNPVCVYVKTH